VTKKKLFRLSQRESDVGKDNNDKPIKSFETVVRPGEKRSRADVDDISDPTDD